MLSDEYISGKSSSHFFSVVIATYNRRRLLKRALLSLINQTEKDWEAIIVDDGSTDDTSFLIKPYLEADSRIKYIYQKNAGYVIATNTGIFSAKGKFITFLDSDDEYTPEHLEIRKRILISNPAIEFLHGGVKVTGSQLVPDRFDYDKMVPLSECEIGGTFFIKREVAVAFNGFKKMPLGSDGDFFERINKAGVNILKTQNPSYIYHRESADSITNNLMPQHEKL